MLAERGTGGAGEGSGDDDAGGSWGLNYRHGGEWKRTSQRGPAALGPTAARLRQSRYRFVHRRGHRHSSVQSSAPVLEIALVLNTYLCTLKCPVNLCVRTDVR